VGFYEAREMIHEKDLLQTGEVTPEQVGKLIRATKGDQYSSAPHRDDPTIEVNTLGILRFMTLERTQFLSVFIEVI
jgi:hypothetical protein